MIGSRPCKELSEKHGRPLDTLYSYCETCQSREWIEMDGYGGMIYCSKCEDNKDE